ncbi:hypothetical protein PENSPDRAFT_751972 [Peniophora sp. CONT]|nr:hypothetical protein PENSPDRAFT_751972 [Peniophora sp. CONT]
MDMTVFPSILPLSRKLSDETDVELSVNDFDGLIQASRDSKAILRAGAPVDIASTASLLGESIHSFELGLEKLRLQYHRLRALEHEKSNVVAPTARLLVEIIRCIFQFDADEHRGTFAASGRIIFAMPGLWANDVFAFGDNRWKQILPLTKEAPLNLDLSRSNAPENVVEQNTISLFRRARRICTSEASHGDLCDVIDIICSASLPHLQTLVLNHDPHDTSEPPMKSQMAEHPHLRFVTLNNIYLVPPFQGGLDTLKLDLSGLMDSERPHPDAVLPVLLRNTNLRCLELRNHCATVLPEPGPLLQRTTFPSLSSLHYEHTGDVHSTTLFNHLRLPQLQYAEVRVQDQQSMASTLVILRRIMRLWLDDEENMNLFSWQSIAITVQRCHWARLRELNRELLPLSRSSGVQLTARMADNSLDRPTRFVVERRR